MTRAAQTGPSPRTVLDELKRACQANDSHATRQALDAWARQQPETLADMAARFVPLSNALDGLNGALYSETGQHWQGDELWRVIRATPMAERVHDPEGDSGLPPFYPKQGNFGSVQDHQYRSKWLISIDPLRKDPFNGSDPKNSDLAAMSSRSLSPRGFSAKYRDCASLIFLGCT
ncbi:hypothetical protein PS659_06078 [Pseudomonas fluorescens]|uniref:DUF7939 domain-containing protein n=1 Tax=Pseudomonas fluorescens TaxID=294 RepID=A0A5E6Y675_PSEFL|nr:hypothetical protein PS659_06078 [Pseudomonas fluorescens]